MLKEIQEKLDRVLWNKHDSAEQKSTYLTALQVNHGFTGIGISSPHTLTLKQVHSNIVHNMGESSQLEKNLEGDGLFTKTTNLSIAVKTADCLPLLFCDKNKTAVAATHAGWRGFCAGIIDKTLDHFLRNNVLLKDLHVVIGPAISLQRFEVGPEVVVALSKAPAGFNESEMTLMCSKGREDRSHIDLQLAAVLNLIKRGLPAENIEVLRTCTFDSLLWNSYRREKAYVGSNLAYISL
jgi:YfiH family protein